MGKGPAFEQHGVAFSLQHGVAFFLLLAASFCCVDAQIGLTQSNQTSVTSHSTAQNQTALGALVMPLETALQARFSTVNLSLLSTNLTTQALNLSQPVTAAVNLTGSSSSALNSSTFLTTTAFFPFNLTSSSNQTFLSVLLCSPANTATSNAALLPLNGALSLSCHFTFSNNTSSFSLNATLNVNSTLTSDTVLQLQGSLTFGSNVTRGTVLGRYGASSPSSAPLPQLQPLAPVAAPSGVFTNPILFADFADPDVIRVQNDFYMAATSFHMFPGAPIMHSRDLINWEYLSHAIPELPPSINATCYDLKGCSEYGVGTWANSLRFFNNTFYLLTNMNDNGLLLSRASNPAGPWNVTKLGWYCQDPGLLFDDDGSIYVVGGHGTLTVYPLGPVFEPLSNGTQIINDTVTYPGFGSPFYGIEGSHMYKINGSYYVYSLWGGGKGQQMALRASQPTGPYSYYTVLKGLGQDNLGYKDRSVHQGSLVNTSNGEWWSVLLQDHDAVGRVPILQQVAFVNGWPTIGNSAQLQVPYPSGIYTPSIFIATSDEFNSTALGQQWQWNHQPDNTRWSLAERPGYLTLHTATVTPNGNLTQVRNQLTQRVWGPQSVATVALDVSNMTDGDVAGLSVFQVQYAYIGVQKTGGSLSITQVVNSNVTATAPFSGTTGVVYFQATFVEGSQQATFAYSTDGQTFIPLGSSWTLNYVIQVYVGFRFGLFSFNTAGSLNGSAAFDYMRVSIVARNSS